ncbi:MAG: hypothetical protein DRQ06_01845 [Candidatus Hydrothermota bacterium]|nr:MAG: hypothetical protein DRQ06_01845 [Candidatus Hydrothermae bacterium]
MGNWRIAPDVGIDLNFSKVKAEIPDGDIDRTSKSFTVNLGTFFYSSSKIGDFYEGIPLNFLWGVTPSLSFNYSALTESEKASSISLVGGLSFQTGLEFGLKIHGREFKIQGRTGIAELSYTHQLDKQGEAKSSSNTVSFRSLGIWRGEISTYLFMRL